MPFDLPRNAKGLRFPDAAANSGPLGKPRPRRAAPGPVRSTRDLYEVDRAPQKRLQLRPIALSPDIDPEEGIATTAMERDALDVLPGASRRHRTEGAAPAMPIPNFRQAQASPWSGQPMMLEPLPQDASQQSASTNRELRAPLLLWLAIAVLGGLASYFIAPLAIEQVVPAFAARTSR